MLITLALLVGVGYLVHQGRSAPEPTANPEPVIATSPPAVPTHFESLDAPPEPVAVAPPAPRRAGPTADPGLCAPPDEESLAFPRPSLSPLLNETIDELRSRVRLIRTENDASEALRMGLSLLNVEGRGEEAVRTIASAADRARDGFDFGAAAVVVASAKAIGTAPERARRIAELGTRLFPDSGPVWVLTAHLAQMDRDDSALQSSLRQAIALGYDEPGVVLALGRSLANTPEQGLAEELLRSYLAEFPDDLQMARLAARLFLRQGVMENYQRIERSGVVVLYHPDVPADFAQLRLAGVISALTDAARWMRSERRAELTVAIHGSKREMSSLTCIPGWADGLFDGVLRFAADADRSPESMEQLVRHESFHAQLASRVPKSPYWLNEGLAQRFAGEVSPAHFRDWSRIRDTGVFIPFPSLEGSFLDIDDGAAAGLAYHQSYAMVSLLIDQRGERVVGDAVDYLASGRDPRNLIEFMNGGASLSGAALTDFLTRWPERQ